MPLRLAFILILAGLLPVLTSCDSTEPGKLSLDDYEGAEGEAVVRYVIKNLPPIAPEVPKVYTVVKGIRLKSTDMAFVKRMDDLKLTFVSGEVLTMSEPDKTIIDPRSRLAPVTIQIQDLQRAGGDNYKAVAGWAYKKHYERHQYKLVKSATGAGYEVQDLGRLEGNYVNDPAVNRPATPAPPPAKAADTPAPSAPPTVDTPPVPPAAPAPDAGTNPATIPQTKP